MRNESISRVHRALEAVRAGKMVVMVDDEDRENEGDLVMAAENVTPEAINFMARFGRGLICLAMEPDRISALGIPMMVENNFAAHSTAFTVSIEARHGVTTGISAADRAQTIRVAISDAAKPSDLVSPGHVFPLKAAQGGVLQRTGHTEGSVDLARLAGCKPAGVICEIMNDDGTMARLPQLEVFCKEHDLLLLSIADLIQYRLQKERLIRKIAEGELALAPNRLTWKAHVFEYDAQASGIASQMLALTLGEIDASPTLVRVHVGSVLGDVFGARAGIRMTAMEAIRRIEVEGRGVILFIPQRLDLVDDLYYHLGRDVKPGPQFSSTPVREVGLGSQVLMDLGVRKMRLLTNRPRKVAAVDGFDLEVVEQVLLRETKANQTEKATHTTH